MIKNIKKYLSLTSTKIFIFYLVITSIFFAYFYKNSPPVAGDAYLYNELSDKLIQAKLNIFSFNFGFRTFLYPLFLSICKILAIVIHKNLFKVIYLAQFATFHISNYVLYKLLKKHSAKAATLFIIFSSFNLINLSFVNLLLTENLSFLFVALILYFFAKSKKNIVDIVMLSLFSSLAIYLRPAFLLMFIVIVFVITYQLLFKEKNVFKLLIFILISSSILSIGIINSKINSHTLSIFNPRSTGEYMEQIYHGSFLMKYETNIDPTEKSQIMQYIYKGRYYLLNNHCKDEILTCIGIYKSPQCPKSLITCQIQSLQSKPADYITLNSLHLFNFFDRTYIDTYIKKISDRNILLQFGNYVVLSSAILIFFIKKDKKIKNLINSFALFIVINTLLYIPTKVEPRFSSPIFPILLMLTALYFVNIIKNKEYRYLLINGFLISLFFIISELVNLTLYVGDIPVHFMK